MTDSLFKTPPLSLSASGKERCVGYEFEFTGVEMPDAAEMIHRLYGGNIQRKSTFEYGVNDTDFGNFTLELDAQLLRDKKYEKTLQSIGVDITRLKNLDSIEEGLKDIAAAVVPFEIITPPLPLSEMKKLNLLIDELRAWKAKGTGSSVFYAFGLHINPEIPSAEPQSLLNHLRAFVMLEPWIRKDADIDISRRVTPYINEFKEEYIKHILNPVYQPDLRTLIGDYFKFKNSRNRPLDMLPVFMHLDEDFTQNLLEETLTSARPTYHYRLPNCSIENPNWTLADEWNRWVLVEILANDKTSLNQYARAWLKMKSDTLIRFEAKWIKLMQRWVNNVQ